MPNKENTNDRSFSSTEVGTLIESFRSDLSAVAEGVTALRVDANILKEDVSQLKKDMTLVKDVIRGTLPRISALELKAAG